MNQPLSTKQVETSPEGNPEVPGVEPDSKEYQVCVKTQDLNEAICAVASALYTLVEEALAAHEDHEAEECEFELFARDLLGVLARHADQLAELESPLTDDPDLPPDELAEE